MKSVIGLCVCILVSFCLKAQNGTVKSYTKIGGAPGSLGDLSVMKKMGLNCAMIGDLDGDGVKEIAAQTIPGGGSTWYVIIFKLNKDGTTKPGYTRLGNNLGGINNPPVGTSFTNFGSSIADMGDLDGNGVPDLAIGCSGGQYVLITYMNSGGTADSFKRITDGFYGFNDPLEFGGEFGCSVANIGDLDNDGINDIAVGAYRENDKKGSVRILFMNADETVKSITKIGSNIGGFIALNDFTQLGTSISSLGDLDGDGNIDLLVGAHSPTNSGVAYTLFLKADGTIKNYYYYEPGTSSFPDSVFDGDFFGNASCNIGDIDGDTVTDVAISALGYDSVSSDKGRIWIMFLNRDGSPKDFQKIDGYLGGFNAQIDSFDNLGMGLTAIGDFNGDGIYDICATAPGDDDGDPAEHERDSGAFYFLYLNGVPIPDNIDDVAFIQRNNITIYPNPATDLLQIEMLDNEVLKTIKVFDVSGKLVTQQKFVEPVYNYTLDINNLVPGTYIIRINDLAYNSATFMKK